MKAALKVVSGGRKDPRSSRKDMEAQFESNTGFDPEDPPPLPKESSKPPWESTLQTDHRRSAKIFIVTVRNDSE